MSKKHLLPQENEEFLERLGLTETDVRVYIATLDGGLVSAGEIQQLTGIKDLTLILDSLRDLTNIGLIKTAQGHMPRYYATLPFFRETLSVEREFMFTLEEMIQSLKSARAQTTRNRERILSLEFPKIINELLDNYYKAILSPIIAELSKFRDQIEDSVDPFAKEVERENTAISNELVEMLKPLTDYTELVSQRFVLGVSNEETLINQILATRKQERLQSLQKAHAMIGTHISTLTNTTDQISHHMQTITHTLDQQSSYLQSTQQNVNEQLTAAKQTVANVTATRDEFQAELLSSREAIKQILGSSGVKGGVVKKVDKEFDKLINIIKKISLEPGSLIEQSSNINSLLQTGIQELSSKQQELHTQIDSLSPEFSQNMDSLKTDMTQVFNEINDQDEVQLQKLREAVMRKLGTINQNILEEAKEVKLKLSDKLQELQQRREMGLNLWKERITTLYATPAKTIDSFLQNWVDDIQPLIESFKQTSGTEMKEILDPIATLENETFGVLNERIAFVKAMIEARAKDLQKILEFAKTFDFTKSSDTWVVVGLPAIYACLADLLLRTKSKVTVVTPHLDMELIAFARRLGRTVRVTFVADIDVNKDARIIERIEEEYGRIQLRNYPDRNLYAGFRDDEEILFGYIKEGEETVGIRASSLSMVELLKDRLNETVIKNSKPIS